jgi:hypothetical protein
MYNVLNVYQTVKHSGHILLLHCKSSCGHIGGGEMDEGTEKTGQKDFIQGVFEMYGSTLGLCSMHKNSEKICVNMGPWMLHL